MSKLRLLSLFSGIGSFEKALSNIGLDYELVGFSEVDKWATESYCAIHNVSKDLNLGDVKEIDENVLPDIDMVTFGFPCTNISVSGKGEGIKKGTSSGLLYEAERIIKQAKPKYAIAENVRNLVGRRHKEDFDLLLGRLEGYGYNNYWTILNAKDFNVPQNRERVFIISIRKDIDDGKFKFPEGSDSGVRLKDLLLDEVEGKYYLDSDLVEPLNQKTKVGNEINQLGMLDIKGNEQARRVYGANGVSSTLNTMQGGNRELKVLEPIIAASRGRYVKGSSGETRQNLELNETGNTNTITTVQKDNWVIEPKVAVREAIKKGYDIASVGDTINLAFPNSKTRRGRVQKDLAGILDTQCNQAILEYDYRIRKLTPLECWRLMDFEDKDYWTARKKLEEVFYNGGDRSNSQMYKQAGNAIVVSVLEEIFRNLLL